MWALSSMPRTAKSYGCMRLILRTWATGLQDVEGVRRRPQALPESAMSARGLACLLALALVVPSLGVRQKVLLILVSFLCSCTAALADFASSETTHGYVVVSCVIVIVECNSWLPCCGWPVSHSFVCCAAGTRTSLSNMSH